MNPAEIREFRNRHGLTQRVLAELLVLKTPTVQAWEVGRRTPPPAAAVILELVESGFVTISDLDRAAERVRRRAERRGNEDGRAHWPDCD